MYAIVHFKGYQFKVEKDAIVKVPYLADQNAGDIVSIDEVLVLRDENDITFGTPNVNGAVVTAEVLGHKKDKKIIVFKKKRRQGYKKKNGHRQNFTEIKIQEIKR